MDTLYLQINQLKTAFMPCASTLPDAKVNKWKHAIKEGYKSNDED